MIELRIKDSGEKIGEITEEQLRFVIGELEEENSADTDYWVDADTIEFLREDGADETLLGLLSSAIEGKEGAEISWRSV